MDWLNALFRRLPVWPVYVAGCLPAPYLLFLAATGRLGVEPIEALEHELGKLALQLLVLGLAVTPLRRFAGLNLMKFRRAIGLVAFFNLCCHLLVWLVLDVQTPQLILADILKRPYVTIGMTAFVLLVPLAITSNNASVRILGRRWRLLHRLIYPAVVMGALHYVWLSKGFRIEPLIYLGAILALLVLRMPSLRRRQPA